MDSGDDDMRLFIGFSFSPDVSSRIEDVITSFKRYMESGRTTKRDLFHVTLVFLGDTDLSLVPKIKEAMNVVNGEPFDLVIKDISTFKEARKGKTFYLNIEHDQKLLSIENQLRQRLLIHGFSIDQRPYHPHLTIARNAVIRDSDAIKTLNSAQKAIPLTIDKIELFESDRRNHEPIYRILHTKRF